MNKDTGGPAFPEAFYANVYAKEPTFREGMTLRDWFAGQAMMGTVNFPDAPSFENAAKQAYAMADAMIAERSKP